MKIPKKLKMFGYTWTVEIGDPGIGLGASYNWDDKEILVGEQDTETCFMHEIVELCLVHLGFRYSSSNSIWQFFMSHKEFTVFVELLWQVLSENKLLKES